MRTADPTKEWGHFRQLFYQGAIMSAIGLVNYVYWAVGTDGENVPLFYVAMLALFIGGITVLISGIMGPRRARGMGRLKAQLEMPDFSDYSDLSREKKLAALDERYKEGKMGEEVYLQIRKRLESQGSGVEDGPSAEDMPPR